MGGRVCLVGWGEGAQGEGWLTADPLPLGVGLPGGEQLLCQDR